ncbi:hypothetical protein J2T09_001562 [Neorhizobium huautlense]|uniref:Uncharacterized protein n=1 Tax=Neorhizobium huautlense TaxID=67774 RepID=A0ABT9PQS3_9HYPH|nr:hypothetical protein [Neorhizobium huautlense]MDP9836817.1 hypothetical protein [Neorhizobium huautlense]
MAIILISLGTRSQTRVKLPLISVAELPFSAVLETKKPVILASMHQNASSLRLPLMLAGFLLASGLLILCVAGWLHYGSEIFITMAETGMAWCL